MFPFPEGVDVCRSGPQVSPIPGAAAAGQDSLTAGQDSCGTSSGCAAAVTTAARAAAADSGSRQRAATV